MKKSKLTFLIFFSFSIFEAKAQEFKNFSLKGALAPKAQMRALEAKSFGAEPDISENSEAYIAKKILDLDIAPNEVPTFSRKSLDATSVSDEKMSLLYQKISDILQSDFQSIGEEQTGPLVYRHQFGSGLLNFSGFSWQKPMGNFIIGVDREIAPDLFSNRYIVHDSFVIGIDATTFLTSMRDADLIDITDGALGAFAGISFSRVYHYYHFADTYLEGIQADYSKLFLPFAKFTPNHTLSMNPYEIMKKNDRFTFNAGGIANVPLWYGLSFQAGVLAQVSYNREVVIQSVGPRDSSKRDEFLRVSLDKAVKKAADVHVGLQIDFFNLLKISILSYDLEYSYQDANQYAVSFYEQDKKTIQNSRGPASEFSDMIKGKVESPIHWRDHVVQLQQRLQENLNSQFSFLLLGKIRKNQTEKVAIIQDGIETVFYKHYSESLKYIQNFWSRLFNTAIMRLFKLNTGIKNAAEESKMFTLEYEHQEELGEQSVDSVESFSIILSQEFQAASTHRWYETKYKNEAIRHLKALTSLNHDYSTMVRREELRGPLSITSHLRVEKSGFRYLNELDQNHVFNTFISVCGVRDMKWQWLSEHERQIAFKKNQKGAHSCVKNLGLKYYDYFVDVDQHQFHDLNKFKAFVTSFFKETEDYRDLAALFGPENVFLNGSFMATTARGEPFQAYFKEGEFKGLGVIDNFSRQSGTSSQVVNIGH